jgi:hypothetical protein
MTIYLIEDYQFGKITISGASYTKDLIILPGRIISGWWRKEGHLLQIDDLAEVMDAKPQQLVIGMGANSRMRVADEVEQALTVAGIEWTALPTDEACQVYNHRAPAKDVAAALHLTC